MKKSRQAEGRKRKWLFPVVCVLCVLISAIPPYAEKPFAPQDAQDVVISLLMVSVNPYRHLAPLFHIGTLLIVLLIAVFRKKMGRVLAAYVGLNYLVIALLPTMGTTEEYGFVIHWGALIMCVLLGLGWVVVAIRSQLEASCGNAPRFWYVFLPLAVLAFWSPYDVHGAQVKPCFDPALLLTSPDYGLTFCLTTPVLLFLFVLFYPEVNNLVYRSTAFNGVLYGLFNMTHFFDPKLCWMGVLHLPLLLISLYALILPGLLKREAVRTV